MSSRQFQQHIVDSLAESADLSGAPLTWVALTLQLFPVPDANSAPYLFRALQRIARGVSWFSEVPGATEQSEALDEVLAAVAQANIKTPGAFPDVPRAQLLDGFAGSFALAGSLYGPKVGAPPLKGLEALRAVLWTCGWRWFELENRKGVVLQTLGSAIRGVGRSGGSLEPKTLFLLGEATSFSEFRGAAKHLEASQHTGIAAAWADHIGPELAGIAREPSRRPPRPKGTGAPPLLPIVGPNPAPAPKPPAPIQKKLAGFDEDREVELLEKKIKKGYLPAPASALPSLPGELPEEHQPAVHAAILPAVPRHKDARLMRRHQMQQSVWGSNSLLLPNHADVMPLESYGLVARALAEEIDSAQPHSEAQLGLAGLLLQGITGRTPRTLTAINVLEDASRPHDPRHMDFLMEEGAFRLSVFWQVGWQDYAPASYFKPDESQVACLEAVDSVFTLPIADPFLHALRSAAQAMRTLARTDVDQIEHLLRSAARQISVKTNQEFTPGRLRASLSAHLFDQCRDTALTQLICADALSPSKAPLSYYAPRTRDIAGAYWTLQQSMLGDTHPASFHANSDARVGARLMARQDAVREMVRAPSAPLKFGVERLVAEERGFEVHAAMLNQLATMLIGAMTHRPGEALFALTLHDVWMDGDTGGALFRDKVHDAAHDPRLVALPAIVCRQIRAYLKHLQGMADRHPSLRGHVEKVLEGRAPLLFAVLGNGDPAPLTFPIWKEGLPTCWGALPLNWGRAWLRTHGVEAGISPELVNIQLGHLEAVGYPFSGASPTEPQDFIADMAPEWERLVRDLGWKVIRGYKFAGDLTPKLLTPLTRWKSRIHAHEAQVRKATQAWRIAMQSKTRAYREQAEATVLAHPELIAEGITPRFRAPGVALSKHAVTRVDFERIRDELYDSAGDDLAVAMANADALCRIAKRVNKKTGQPGADPAPMTLLRRPLDNAFVPGMMQAVRQVHEIRNHLASWSSENKPGPWQDFSLACARVSIAMAVFGFCDDPDKIRGAIERRHLRQRPAALDDAILVPYGDSSHQVLGLRGIAATAFARLAWKLPDAEFPGWDAINSHVKSLLPGWAVPRAIDLTADGAGLVGVLCETVSVANRFEMSPAARRAMSAKWGTTDAHINDQVALIDGDPAGTIEREWEDQREGIPHERMISRGKPGTGNARSQYLALCGVFPSPDKDTSLQLTGVTIASGEAAADVYRTAIANEIRAMIDEESPPRRLQPIVRLLAGWTIDMLLNGTAKAKKPAFKTVETYLSRIGGGLVEIFGQSSLDDLDESELEDAYTAVIAAKRKMRSQTAAAILGFHRFGLADIGLPDVDLAPVYAYLKAQGVVLADARFILPSERSAILAELERQTCEAPVAADPARAGVRIVRHALAVAPLIAFGGTRRSEALGLQFRDISADENSVHVRIRANSSRRMKTACGRRKLEVPSMLFPSGQGSLAGWAQINRDRLASQRVETAFVFAPLDDARSAEARSDIAEACLRVCRKVTRNDSARLHAFRHLVAMEQTFPAFLSISDLERLSDKLRLIPLATQYRRTILPRDLQSRVLSLGQHGFETTLQWYHHLSWLLRSRADARLSDRFVGREILATLLGVTVHAMDMVAKKTKDVPKAKAWLDVQCETRQVPRTPEPPLRATDPPPPKSWSARELGGLLADVSRLGSLSNALLVCGADAGDAERIRQALLPLESRLGRRLMQEVEIDQIAGRPRRTVRPLTSVNIEILWQWYDEDRDGLRNTLSALAESLVEHLSPTDLDKVRLPTLYAVELETLLGRIPEKHLTVQREALGAGLEFVRVPRPGIQTKADTPERKLGLVLRYLGLEIKRILLVIRMASKGF